MAEELSVILKNPEIIVGNNGESLHFHNKPNFMHSVLSEATLLERIGAEFVIYQNVVSGKEITDNFYVLNWFQIHKMKFFILTRFSYIIHSIAPSQTENERFFSLVGIYTASRRTNISVEMPSF